MGPNYRTGLALWKEVDAMSNINGERSVTIRAPIDEVFDYVSDFTRHGEWNHQIIEVTKVSDGPAAVGTRFHAKERPPKHLSTPMKLIFPLMLRMVGMDDHTEAEITHWEPGRKIAWIASAPLRSGDVWMRAEWELALLPEGNRTTVFQRFHYTPVHERAKRSMSEQKATEMINKEVTDNLHSLKHLLESRIASQRRAEKAAVA